MPELLGRGAAGVVQSALVTAVLGRAAVTPVLAAPDPRSEQVTQLLLGEGADQLAREGDWHRVRLRRDGYEGWAHAGYLRACPTAEADRWQQESWWSAGAMLTVDGHMLPLDPGSRVLPLAEGSVELPDGRHATVASGSVGPPERMIAESRRERAEEWALSRFAGAPYQWGGMTPRGVDCSGLVQMTFLLRGVSLPRDARDQAESGRAVIPDAVAPSDLLFFAEREGRIAHVAFASATGGLVHATLACGGVLAEPWGPGTRAESLRARLVAARRIE
ncbi:MAG: NlpC/P60 family protein [Gemmatimonadales bacterium]